MNVIYDIISQYWALGVAAVFGAGYVVTHRQAAIAYAKRRAITLMMAAEKRAEALVLTDGPAKFAWVVDKGYDMLPSAVRLFVSKPLFKSIVQTLFDDAVAFAQSHIAVQPAAAIQPATPVTPPPAQ